MQWSFNLTIYHIYFYLYLLLFLSPYAFKNTNKLIKKIPENLEAYRLDSKFTIILEKLENR